MKDEKQLATLSEETVAIIGAGKMGGAILDSLITSAGIPPERLRCLLRLKFFLWRNAQISSKAF